MTDPILLWDAANCRLLDSDILLFFEGDRDLVLVGLWLSGLVLQKPLYCSGGNSTKTPNW